jgi:hypothetical protein
VLSIKECKKLLNEKDTNYTDEEIVEIRDLLYLWASITVEATNKKENGKGNTNG